MLPPDSMAITHEIGLTASVEILRDITGGVGPSHTIVSLAARGGAPVSLIAK